METEAFTDLNAIPANDKMNNDDSPDSYDEEVPVAADDDEKWKSASKRVSGGCAVKICQADKCGVDLTDAKTYHRRHKVCEHHAKAPVVIVDGIRQRFCQQCSRFHEVSEFDEAKRSCRRRLAGHNERRRKIPAAEGGKVKEDICDKVKSQMSGEDNGNYKQFHVR